MSTDQLAPNEGDRRDANPLRVASTTRNSVELTWVSDGDLFRLRASDARLLGYSVRYRPDGGTLAQRVDLYEPSRTGVEIRNLHENTDYEICVKSIVKPPVQATSLDAYAGQNLFSRAAATYSNLRTISDRTNSFVTASLSSPHVILDDDADGGAEYLLNREWCLVGSTSGDSFAVVVGSLVGALLALSLVILVVLVAKRRGGGDGRPPSVVDAVDDECLFEVLVEDQGSAADVVRQQDYRKENGRLVDGAAATSAEDLPSILRLVGGDQQSFVVSGQQTDRYSILIPIHNGRPDNRPRHPVTGANEESGRAWVDGRSAPRRAENGSHNCEDLLYLRPTSGQGRPCIILPERGTKANGAKMSKCHIGRLRLRKYFTVDETDNLRDAEYDLDTDLINDPVNGPISDGPVVEVHRKANGDAAGVGDVVELYMHRSISATW